MKNRAEGRRIRRWRKKHGYRTRDPINVVHIESLIDRIGKEYIERIQARIVAEVYRRPVPQMFFSGVNTSPETAFRYQYGQKIITPRGLAMACAPEFA